MALPVFNPPIRPSPGTGFKPTINLLAAEFGDGYSQSSPKGLNHIRQTITLKWDGLLLEQFRAIDDFFLERGGYKPFLYQVHGDAKLRRWTCKEFSGQNPPGIFEYTATLVEDFSNANS